MKKVKFILIASIVFLTAGTNGFADTGKAVEYRNKGYQAQLSGKLDEAIKYYKLAVKEDKNFAEVHNDLGIAYEIKGKSKDAEKEYLRTLNINPKNLSAHSNLAVLYERQGDINNAIDHWRERVRLAKEDDPWRKKALEHLAAYGADVEAKAGGAERVEAPKVEAEPPKVEAEPPKAEGAEPAHRAGEASPKEIKAEAKIEAEPPKVKTEPLKVEVPTKVEPAKTAGPEQSQGAETSKKPSSFRIIDTKKVEKFKKTEEKKITKKEKPEKKPKEKPDKKSKTLDKKANEIAKQYAEEKKNGKKTKPAKKEKAAKKTDAGKKQEAIEKEFAGEKTTDKKGKIKEALEKTKRAGYAGYYYEGEGYGITPWLGVSSYTEIYDEPDPIDDMIFESKVMGHGNSDQFKTHIKQLTTRAYAGRITFDNKKVEWLPRIRYTRDFRITKYDFLTRYGFVDIRQDTNEIDIQKTYEYDYVGFVTWNPGYKRVILSSNQDNPTSGHRDDYYFAFTIIPNDIFESYTKFEYYEEKKVNTTWISKPKYGLGRVEFRIKVPPLKLRLTPGVSYSKTIYRPTSNTFAKTEIFLDTGADFTDRLRGEFKIQNTLHSSYDTAIPDQEAKVSTYDLTNKLSYEVIKDLDLSAGLNYAHAPGKIDAFDNISPLIEGELFKPGKIRIRTGYQFVDYFNLNETESIVYMKAYLFM